MVERRPQGSFAISSADHPFPSSLLLDLVSILSEMGSRIVGPCSSSGEARETIDRELAEIAILDNELSDSDVLAAPSDSLRILHDAL
jgi:hypothetical protein